MKLWVTKIQIIWYIQQTLGMEIIIIIISLFVLFMIYTIFSSFLSIMKRLLECGLIVLLLIIIVLIILNIGTLQIFGIKINIQEYLKYIFY